MTMTMTILNNYLNERKKTSEHIEIFLLNGIRLSGKVQDFDDECILLNSNQIIRRDALSTVQIATQ